MFVKFGFQYINHFSGQLPKFEDEYIRAFVSGGIDKLTRKWIENGMLESHDEMASKVTKMLLKA